MLVCACAEDVERVRALRELEGAVERCVTEHRLSAAAYFAEKLVCVSGRSSAALLTYANVLYRQGEHDRAIFVLETDGVGLGCVLGAMRALRVARRRSNGGGGVRAGRRRWTCGRSV